LQEWLERPDVRKSANLAAAIRECDAIVFAVPHAEYKRLTVADLSVAKIIVDANNVIGDPQAAALHASGGRVAGVGKGHWRKHGYHLNS
jgi:UDP-N-acetyl-D-mannosaminuronate dehydrogenase